ncbi:MAG: MBL fold metallo-hydrolase, partial [Pseudomonadota bacterium]
MRLATTTFLFPLLIALSACGAKDTTAPTNLSEPATPVSLPPPGVATEYTKQLNADAAGMLNIARAKDQERASRGLLATLDRDAIVNEEGRTVWDVSGLDFLQGPAPDSAHPALWRQMQLTSLHGLFEVTDGIYQVRGYDLAVMTIIRGNTGWIIIDPLTTVETAAAALELVQSTLGERPVSALIYTHSHADHFGGAEAIINAPGNDDRDIPVIAPLGFTEEAVSENLMAGAHMARRSVLMYGGSLTSGTNGKIGSGLGPGLASGRISLVRPTVELAGGTTEREIDGITFEFSDAGGTEAPSELVFYLPAFRALCTAEVVSGTFHNILTIRGAKVRDALTWSKAIDGILRRYEGKTDVMFASHHWPLWGANDIELQLRQHRDLYRRLHDQTLRYANAGATLAELPSLVKEPSFATENMSVRGYYGSHGHNTKAVYQHYFGWWG